MLNLERILNQDRLLRAITGLNRKAFEALLVDFTEADENSRLKPEMERQRALGGGRKATLRSSREKLLYIPMQESSDTVG
jgi:hypothetical protein